MESQPERQGLPSERPGPSGTPESKDLFHASLILFFGIVLGAFGAHGLQKYATAQGIATYQTGVTYHIYHGIGLLFLGLCAKIFPSTVSTANLNKIKYFFYLGIIFFSGNCYLYAITQAKAFALLVPIGGLSFLAGWLLLAVYFMPKNSSRKPKQ